MIRGNYSLAKDIRKNELRQKQRLQQRQRTAHRTSVLRDADPKQIYFQIQKLEKTPERDPRQQKRLDKLREDWAFIRKNKLHQDTLEPFLAGIEQERVRDEKEARRLRGKDSVYFNPELNPLGKVPWGVYGNVAERRPFPNVAKPLARKHSYLVDPLIGQLGIQPPKLLPVRFYKEVQNVKGEPKVQSEGAERRGNSKKIP